MFHFPVNSAYRLRVTYVCLYVRKCVSVSDACASCLKLFTTCRRNTLHQKFSHLGIFSPMQCTIIFPLLCSYFFFGNSHDFVQSFF